MNQISREAFQWIECVLYERYGLNLKLKSNNDNSAVVLELVGCNNEIRLDVRHCQFYRSDSNISMTHWDVSEEEWQPLINSLLPAPGAKVLPKELIYKTHYGYYIGYNIIGLIYWMLTREEEIGRCDLDSHGRFPATASHAYNFNYLERPVVDEWLHILGQVINRAWPNVNIKQHAFKMMISHDVDQPSLYAFKSWSNICRVLVGHLFKRFDFAELVNTLNIKISTKDKLLDFDPYNLFDWLMDKSDEHGFKSEFNFIAGRTCRERDADYDLDHPAIRNLLRKIHARGHQVGFHPSYNSYRNPEVLKGELKALFEVCREEGVSQREWGVRMHYLRWEHPTTMRALANLGLTYDSTLGYADRPGFRCGTCFEYQAFDPILQVQLPLRIRPLIVMECSVMDSKYMGLGINEYALNKILEIKATCKSAGGQFSLLWHNSYFKNPLLKDYYLKILSQ